MIRNKKKMCALLIILFVIAGMTGCARFDASGYAKAVLDVNFKNDTKQYIEMTGEQKKAADAIYTDNVDGILTSFLSGIEVSDEVMEQGEKVFGDILKSAQYTVGKAEQKDDEYTVDVTFKQMKIFQDAIEEYTAQIDAYTAELEVKSRKNEAIPTEQEINDQVAVILFDILQSKLDKGITYGKDTVLTLHITENDKHVCTIDNADYKQIISYAMDSETVK